MVGSRKNIVLYHGGTPFEGDSAETRPLGGSESAMIMMMRELHKLGYEATVFCRCEKEGFFSGVRYLNIGKARHFLKEHHVQVFIAQTSSDAFSLEMNAGLKVFWTGGNHDVRALQALSDRELQKQIDCFFFISRWQAENFQKKFGIPKDRVFMTRNGFDPSLFKGGAKKVKYRMIYLSSPGRGLDILLDVFPGIRKRFKSAELHVFSDYEFYGEAKGSWKHEHPEIAGKIDREGITHHGNIRRDRLAEELEKAYIMPYPTHFRETSCMAAIEAQAAGTPPVATRLAALPETIEHGKTGILVPGRAGSLIYRWRFAREVIRLFEDEKRWGSLSEAGKKRMYGDFEWSKIAIEWDAFFRSRANQ